VPCQQHRGIPSTFAKLRPSPTHLSAVACCQDHFSLRAIARSARIPIPHVSLVHKYDGIISNCVPKATFNNYVITARICYVPYTVSYRTKHKRVAWKSKASDAPCSNHTQYWIHRQSRTDPFKDPNLKSFTMPIASTLSLPRVTCMQIQASSKQDHQENTSAIQAYLTQPTILHHRFVCRHRHAPTE
jgi:hypothetical protein